MNTHLGRWRIEDELSLPVLLQYGVVPCDDDRTVRISIRSEPQPKHPKVYAEGQQRCRENKEDDREEDSPQSISQSERLGHEALIIAPRLRADCGRSSLHTPEMWTTLASIFRRLTETSSRR